MRRFRRSWTAVPKVISVPMISVTKSSEPSSSATGRGSRSVSSLPTPIRAANTKRMAAQSNDDIMILLRKSGSIAVR
jgi:hypothetical protein